MQKQLLIFILLLCCLSCKNTEDNAKAENPKTAPMKFDKEKWKLRDEKTIYAYRKRMLDDLVKNIIATKKERPMPKQEILDMLGKPSRIDTLYLFYEVSMEHFGLVPINAVTLVVKLKKDETVDKVLIAE